MKKVKVGKSKIHGNGLFADEPIKRGDVIELVHTMREIEPGIIKTIPTLIGRNYNHSEEPNALNVIDGNNRYLVALKEIKAGGEITTDYRTSPDLEQPDSFTNDNYVSFDYDDTLTTPEGFKLAQKMNKEGNSLYVITARDKVTPQMIERAEAAGIPKENIIPAGSDQEKVRIIKENNITKHIDNKDSVIKALGDKGELFSPDAYPDLKADFVEMDLSDEDLNKLQEGGFIVDQYSDEGIISQEEIDAANNAMMRARLAYAQMHGNPAAQRMIVAPDQPYQFEDGDTGTHFMASMGEYAVPLIQNVNGQLMLGDFGSDSREAIRFDNPEDAIYFAENYKEVSPAFEETELTEEEIEEYRKGGWIVEELDKYPRGGGRGKGKSKKPTKSVKFKPKGNVAPFITSNPEEYAYRKAAYDDSLHIANTYNKIIPDSPSSMPYYYPGTQILHKHVKPKKSKHYLKSADNYAIGDDEKGMQSKAWKNYMRSNNYERNTRDYPDIYNEPVAYEVMETYFPDSVGGNFLFFKTPDSKEGDWFTDSKARYQPPRQKVIFQEPSKPAGTKKSKVIQQKPVVNPEVIQPTPIPEPIPESIPAPIIVNPELQKFVYPETESEGTDVMPVYDETDIEVGTPGPGGDWEGRTRRYIDWGGNSIPYRFIRFRKAGHYGDLIRKGKQRYIPFPSIEKRYDAWIEPGELPEEEYQDGGEPKKKKRKTDDYGRWRGADGVVHTPITPEMQAVMPPDEWGQYVQEIPEVYTTRNAEEERARKELEFLERGRAGYEDWLRKQNYMSGRAQPADWFWQLGLGAKPSIEGLNALAAKQIGKTGITYGTAANTAFGVHGATQIPHVIESWQDVASGKKNWKEAALESGFTALELYGGYGALKELSNISKTPSMLPGSPNSTIIRAGAPTLENQVLIQQQRLLDPAIRAKFFKHQNPMSAVKESALASDAPLSSSINIGRRPYSDLGNRITPENYEDFVKTIHGSTGYHPASLSNKTPGNLGVGSYGRPGTVFSDAMKDGESLSNIAKDVINAHEKNHGMFAGTLSPEMKDALLKPFGGPGKKAIEGYSSKNQADEVLTRMAQFKNALGFTGNERFTVDHLNWIRDNYTKIFIDNGITKMLSKIPQGSRREKLFIENMNEYGFGLGIGYGLNEVLQPTMGSEEEYKDGGEPKGRKKKRDSKGRYRGDKDYIHTPFTEEWKQTYPADEWSQTIQEIPEVYVLGNAERVARDKARVAEEEIARLNYQRYLSAPHMYLPDGSLRQQAAQSADWVWQLGALGATGGAKDLLSAGETLGTRALPYLETAFNTSLPGMASVPGATFGNALGAISVVDSGRRLLDVPSQVQKGEYADAAANVLTAALDIGTAGMISPLYKGAKTTASELGKFIGTEEGLLSNAYKVNPFANKIPFSNLPKEGELIKHPFIPNQYSKIENLSNKVDYFHLKADPDNLPYIAAQNSSRWHELNNDPRFFIKRTDTQPQAIIDSPRYFGEDLTDPDKLSIPLKYLNEFRLQENIGNKPHWLEGYKINTGLTDADIAREVAKNIKWITSSEYARRRAANTGESLQEIQKSVDKIIKDAGNAKFNLNANPFIMNLYDAAGSMRNKEWLRPAKVKVSASAEHPLETLKHEIKHLYSPAIHNRNRLYDNYPTLGDEMDDYLAAGAEQQVRHLNAREQILAENNLPIDAQLSEEQVREFADKWRSKINKIDEGATLPDDFDAIWNDEAINIQKEMLKARYNTDDVNFIGTLPTSQRVRFMSEYKDRLTKSITDALNKAWITVPVAGGIEMINSQTPEQRYGGSINKLKKFIS